MKLDTWLVFSVLAALAAFGAVYARRPFVALGVLLGWALTTGGFILFRDV
jgi:hypothetical protein